MYNKVIDGQVNVALFNFTLQQVCENMKVQNISKSWKLGWMVKCTHGHVAGFIFSKELMFDPWN